MKLFSFGLFFDWGRHQWSLKLSVELAQHSFTLFWELGFASSNLFLRHRCDRIFFLRWVLGLVISVTLASFCELWGRRCLQTPTISAHASAFSAFLLAFAIPGKLITFAVGIVNAVTQPQCIVAARAFDVCGGCITSPCIFRCSLLGSVSLRSSRPTPPPRTCAL